MIMKCYFCICITGMVRVSYVIIEGAIDTSTPNLNRAINGQDFIADSGFLDFADGVNVQSVSVTIKQVRHVNCSIFYLII